MAKAMKENLNVTSILYKDLGKIGKYYKQKRWHCWCNSIVRISFISRGERGWKEVGKLLMFEANVWNKTQTWRKTRSISEAAFTTYNSVLHIIFALCLITHIHTHTHSIALQHTGFCVRVCFVSGIICREFSVVRSSIWAGYYSGWQRILCCSLRMSMVA